MRAWRVHQYGRPSEALRLDEIEEPVPEPGKIRVAPTRTVLNFNEIDGCHGRYRTVNPELPYTLGMEVLGTVDAAGEGAEEWLGRRVHATAESAFGGYADKVIAQPDMVFDAPESLDDTEAAAFFFPFHLAWLGLQERGQVQPGEWVLIHAAAGGVGSAAVQLAVDAGARVIGTAGSEAKCELVRSLGAEAAVNYRDGDFATEVRDITGGAGVDLVFDGVGGDVTEASLRCMTRGGRLMIIGFASKIEAEDAAGLRPRLLCFSQVSIGGVLLAYNSNPAVYGGMAGFNINPRSLGDQIHEELCGRLAEGRIAPLVGGTVAFEELPAALEQMEDRLTTGRIVVVY